MNGSATVLGTMLIAIGILFLAAESFGFDVGRTLWPLFVLVPGLAFLVTAAMGGGRLAPLAIPGSIVTMTGLLLLYQNISGHWESWAYAWALVAPTGVGVGFWLGALWGGPPRWQRLGALLAQIGLVLALVLGGYFELGLNLSGRGNSDVVRYGVPLGLLLVGLLLLADSVLKPRTSE